MGVYLKLYGDKEAVAKMNRFKLDKLQDVKDAINTTALNVQRKAKKKAPVDDGRLRSSIVLEPFRGGLSVNVGSRLPYSVYQEYGTGIYAAGGDGRKTPWVYFSPKLGRFVWTQGNKPQPFLHPAFHEEKPDYIKRLAEALRYKS